MNRTQIPTDSSNQIDQTFLFSKDIGTHFANVDKMITMKDKKVSQTKEDIDQKVFLNKKRKNSDLNFDLTQTSVKTKNLKFSNKSPTPNTFDKKITSYFPQEKQTLKRDHIKKLNMIQSINSDGLKKNRSAEKCNFSTFQNFSFGKKLDYDYAYAYEKNKPEMMQSPPSIKFEGHLNYFSNYLANSYARQEKDPQRKKLLPKSNPISEQTLKIINQIQKKRSTVTKDDICQLRNSIIEHLMKFQHGQKISQSKMNCDDILSRYSIKEKYEDLLRRELILPCHYKALLKKLSLLDDTISHLKSQKLSTTLSQISSSMKSFNSSLSIEEFQQILFICPHFFLYKWENCSEITIDIPQDILARLEKVYSIRTNFTQIQTWPYIPFTAYPLDSNIKELRMTTFKKVLLHLTNQYHKKFITENRISGRLNPFRDRTWHSQFDVHNVPEIEKMKLIDPPKKRS